MTTTKDVGTLLPGDDEPSVVEAVFEFLNHGREPGESIRLSRVGPGADPRVIELPGDIADLMEGIVASVRAGHGVTVFPHNRKVTTQQAADLLGVSRPTLVRMLERGEIEHEMVGKHRRILVGDLLAFRNARREAIQDFLAATTLDDDVLGGKEAVRSALRRSRAELASAARKARVG